MKKEQKIKKSESSEELVKGKEQKRKKIQTAEGWKRSFLKRMKESS